MARDPRRIVLYYPKLADERRGLPSGKDVLPLSVLQIAGLPLANGFEVCLIDGNLWSEDEARARVLEACDGALVYAATGILGYQVADGARMAAAVRARHPALTRVVGGWFPSVMPELHLEDGLYHAVCHGQGEITFDELVRALECGEPLESVAGLILWREGRALWTAHRAAVGWERIPAAPWHLIDFERYREHQLRQRGSRLVERLPRPPWIPEPRPYVGIAYFSSYGCPEPCTFCCSPEVTSRRYKAMPASRMLDDLCELKERWGFDVVRFHDANFGVAEKRVREFAEGLLARDVRFGWFVMMQAFSLLRYAPETVDAMAEAGCYMVNVGAETGSEETMRTRIGKHTAGDDNVRAALELDRRGIGSWMTYIIGLPHEPAESMLATIDEACRIRAACPRAHPAVWPYRPIPGTPMYRDAVELGYRPPRTLEEWGTVGEYHLDETWPGKIPPEVARRRELYQHFSTLTHGLARPRSGWFERRAQRRLETRDFRLARVEAKAFDLWRRVEKRLRPSRASARAPAGAGAPASGNGGWESGDGAYAAGGARAAKAERAR